MEILKKTFTKEEANEVYGRYNRSAFYLLPLLELDVNILGENLINTYFSNYGYKLYLKLKQVDKNLLEHPQYESKVENGDCIMVFNIPDKFKEFYNAFKQNSNNLLGVSEEAVGKIYKRNSLASIVGKNVYSNGNGDPEDIREKLLWAVRPHQSDTRKNPLLEYYEKTFNMKLDKNAPLLSKLNYEKECLDYNLETTIGSF